MMRNQKIPKSMIFSGNFTDITGKQSSNLCLSRITLD